MAGPRAGARAVLTPEGCGNTHGGRNQYIGVLRMENTVREESVQRGAGRPTHARPFTRGVDASGAEGSSPSGLRRPLAGSARKGEGFREASRVRMGVRGRACHPGRAVAQKGAGCFARMITPY